MTPDEHQCKAEEFLEAAEQAGGPEATLLVAKATAHAILAGRAPWIPPAAPRGLDQPQERPDGTDLPSEIPGGIDATPQPYRPDQEAAVPSESLDRPRLDDPDDQSDPNDDDDLPESRTEINIP